MGERDAPSTAGGSALDRLDVVGECQEAVEPWGRGRSPARRLFGEGRGDRFGERYLEYVQGVADQGVVTDDPDHLDQAGLAQARARLGESRIGEPLRLEQLAADPVNERLVLLPEAWCFAAADRFDGGSWDTCLLGQRRMGEPLVLRAPETGGDDNCQLGEAVRQRGAPTQVLAELCRVFADLRRADQQLEGPPNRPRRPATISS